MKVLYADHRDIKDKNWRTDPEQNGFNVCVHIQTDELADVLAIKEEAVQKFVHQLRDGVIQRCREFVNSCTFD